MGREVTCLKGFLITNGTKTIPEIVMEGDTYELIEMESDKSYCISAVNSKMYNTGYLLSVSLEQLVDNFK